MTCDRFATSIIHTPRHSRNTSHRRGATATRPGRSVPHLSEFQNARLNVAESRITRLEAELREAREQASHDPLTALFNRRGLEDAFAREAARVRRCAAPLTMALIDLDDFKKINDRYGHAVGDRALQHLTRLMRETMRPTDICARIGGDEFVLLLPATDIDSAQLALARLQQAIASTPLVGANVVLRASIGLVAVNVGEPIEQALCHADGAVYRAKDQGKNQLMAA